MKVRQDAWSHEDDLLLAETVLRHIREGSTQLNAFEEVGDELNRTSAACGFRWNAVVRNQYNEAIKLAKKQRKEMKRRLSYKPSTISFTPAAPPTVFQNDETSEQHSNTINEQPQAQLTLKDVIHFIQSLAAQGGSSVQVRKENEKLMRDNLQLMTEKKELEARLSKLEKDFRVVEEDYQSLIQIMNRARRMALLQDEEEEMSQAPKFRMDKNGNLEKIAK